MGIYHNVNPVYGKDKDGKRVMLGIKVEGKFYKGIFKTGQIPKTASKPKVTDIKSKVKRTLKKQP